MKVCQISQRWNLDFLYNVEEVNNPEEADILLYWGGTDINPAIYGEEAHKYTQASDTLRDKYEMELFNKYPDKFKLGICRGSQFLTAMSGGKLVQHVTNHCVDHKILLDWEDEQYEVTVTSSHHQMMYPYLLEQDEFEVMGYSIGRSEVYYNDTNNSTWVVGEEDGALENFIEPEVVWYPKTKSLAIQSHPEWQNPNCDFVKLLNKIIEDKYE